MSSFDKLEQFAQQYELCKDDYVIIAGDCGVIWSERTNYYRIKNYAALPFSVLFADGNHENFDLLNAYPVTQWKGGKVHQIADSILHLMRGQIFQIQGKSIFTFGGADSTDKLMRTEGESWWRAEMPSQAEYDEAIANLAKAGNKVDYMITHTCDERALYYPPLRDPGARRGIHPSNIMLNNFEETVQYGHWFFGHYHQDVPITDRKTAICNKILRIV